MKIVLTGSIGNIGKPLTQALIAKGHDVKVISSNTERQQAIEKLGAKAAIGTILDEKFLTDTFTGADIVYLMETMDAAGGDLADQENDFIAVINQIGQNYKEAIEKSGVKKVVHLSSVGAHMAQDNGILIFHHNVENILNRLPEDVVIKTMRPVGFYTNMFSFVHSIRSKGVIISNYGGNRKEPLVSPLDIADVIAEEIDKPFQRRIVRYIASDEVSPIEVAKALGEAIGKPDLQWQVIPSEQLLNIWLNAGFNPQVAHGFIEMQESQGNGKLYEDYELHRPVLGKVKLHDFARDFAAAYLQK
ncbi:NAD-dependent epimerase/dehydratase family protein [Mucilaginibacter limnophilus]|uniref:NAD-dependent epimerase/dehydratase family protein n=1 Tax=Mucilaginibacter limnophilus TaxID=1932778 RepID=A0A437MI86_9SPHI|nr:NAD(P)H-binding protein [Mucilaginibacter limnophilus]RVT97336.1 NAD-dependent epimerase/dehydratase family protein [Mucilaginibacter limnophilus]